MKSSRNQFWCLALLVWIASGTTWIQSPPTPPPTPIDPRSLTIHGVRPGMLRTEIEKLPDLERPRVKRHSDEQRGYYAWGGQHQTTDVLDIKYQGGVAVWVAGLRLEKSGNPFPRAVHRRELVDQLGPPNFNGLDEQNARCSRYEDLHLTVTFRNLDQAEWFILEPRSSVKSGRAPGY